jgi:hypothetical protein
LHPLIAIVRIVQEVLDIAARILISGVVGHQYMMRVGRCQTILLLVADHVNNADSANTLAKSPVLKLSVANPVPRLPAGLTATTGRQVR